MNNFIKWLGALFVSAAVLFISLGYFASSQIMFLNSRTLK